MDRKQTTGNYLLEFIVPLKFQWMGPTGWWTDHEWLLCVRIKDQIIGLKQTVNESNCWEQKDGTYKNGRERVFAINTFPLPLSEVSPSRLKS